ncbi:MAG: chloride channel protein [candidate division Zixibacteria bacterium]|nr:chloride channel protein [candidate division Zixibacteria bacterium]
MKKLILKNLGKIFRLSESKVLIFLALVVGTGTGYGAILFISLIEYARELFFGYSADLMSGLLPVSEGGYNWWVIVIPAVGGLLAGPIIYYFAKEAKGHGVPEVMDAVARKGGIIRPQVAAVKALASAICIGSGGSAGREGPIIQIGSAIGSTIGQIFKMSGNRVKILVGCGAAAGISAVFNAPIAGIIFSLEIILGDFAIKTFAPVLLSSVIASVITRSVLGNHPAFEVPAYELVSAWEMPLYVLLGALSGGVAVAFTRVLGWSENFFDNLKIPEISKPAIGGMLLGIVGVFYPQVFADGYSTINLALYSKMTFGLLFILIFLKIAGTSLTLGSGNSGGIFAPSLFMGAMLGGAFGLVVHSYFPDSTATSGAYALVGMAALVGGTTHAPMTAILIIFEMTNDYRIILPLMVAVTISTLVSRGLFEHSIYTIKLASRGIFLRGGKDLMILRSLQVFEVMDRSFETISPSTSLSRIINQIESTRETYYMVVDDNRYLYGIISLQDLRSVLTSSSLDDLIIAEDIAHTDLVTVTPDDDLEQVRRKIGMQDLQVVPVVESENSRKIIAVLRKDDMMTIYNKRLIESINE